jgi:pimeloyl-ACP methyl ester carboxylesterase
MLQHTLIETNGIHLHVTQAGVDTGELVLLLHGFPEFWYGWKRQIPFLAEQGYRVWAPDQRGYNLSEKPEGIAAYSLDHLVADVVGLIEASGREQVYLVGHDWGAAVAWGTAINHPDKIKKLAILNVPHPSVMVEQLRSNPAQMLKSWYIGMFQLPLLPEALLTFGDGMMGAQMLYNSSREGTFTDEDIAQYVRAWKQPGAATAMLNWYRALVQNQPTPPADVRVHVPTLILWGVNDIALGQEMVQPSADLCDEVRVVYFEDAGHWVQHEEADEVSRLLLEFFGSPALKPDGSSTNGRPAASGESL